MTRGMEPVRPGAEVNTRVILRAMARRRAYGSPTEIAFIEWLAERVDGHVDDVGNVHRAIPLPGGGDSRTLFSSHTDSMHKEGGRNRVFITPDGFWTAEPDGKNALGADDATGIALMVEMIDKGVPGHYIFHRGEEVGGIGSKHLAKAHGAWLSDAFDRAIAFDRAGYTDVITHQGGDQCCSDVFAEALAAALNEHEDLLFMPDNSGVYTDTREYISLIPECTNISVGYHHQHGDRETQDIGFFYRLMAAVTKIDWENLPTARDPSVVESLWGSAWVTPAESPADFYENVVLAALDRAYLGDYVDLLCLASEWACPENPGMVRGRLSTARLTVVFLDEQYDVLEVKGDPDLVMANIVDVAFID